MKNNNKKDVENNKKNIDTSLVDKAMKFAIDAHSGTERKGKGFPYIIHPLEAVTIVATITNDPEMLAAAALHDVVEDTDISLEVIEKEFGPRVARLVSDESDKNIPGTKEGASWRERKEYAIAKIKGLDRDGKIVAIGDKLSNMRAIARDYRIKGDAVWEIFNIKDREAHAWHYHGLKDALKEISDTEAYKEFEKLVEEVF